MTFSCELLAIGLISWKGGKGKDAVMFGKIGEVGESGNIEFNVNPPGKPGSQDSNPIFFSLRTNLPLMGVSGSPGFCEIIDKSNAVDGKATLDALNVDHLVKFLLKGERNDRTDDGDNGLRVMLHLKDVETLVCTNPDLEAIQVFDLTQVPAQEIDVDDIPNRKVRNRVKAMIF
ncbi:MAG: hypothetical protein ACPGYT_01240 [Nitrospirales bacterium]